MLEISIHVLREEDDVVRHLLHTIPYISIHVLREEDDHAVRGRLDARLNISIHVLREEDDPDRPRCSPASGYFYPRPPRGGRLDISGQAESGTALFLSTSSARRTTPISRPPGSPRFYFYPRPPRGGRPQPFSTTSISIFYFYPRPPRGGRRPVYARPAQMADFYPRPPRGGRHTYSQVKSIICISIHVLREEDDHFYEYRAAYGVYISIHVLREEDDPAAAEAAPSKHADFYPRPPRGGRRVGCRLP